MKLPKLKWPDIVPPPPGAHQARLSARLLWMAGIWAGCILALLVVAGVLRLVLMA
ncbi:DUF2474 family protein [Actimicrobium antarcticum]|uniref:DUF2474 domain-containing protein n=1 Tax=Actimicrobium antarcticum TaxID=1051899 RepID=A0ABP7TJH7_9BURK